MTLRSFIYIASTIMACQAASFSQDTLSDDDAFSADAFDKSISESTTNDAEAKLEYHPGLILATDATAYAGKSLHYGSDTRLYGTAFVKVSQANTGSLYAGCNFNYFLYAASDNAFFRDFYKMQSPDPSEVTAALSELHFSFDINKTVFVRVGKQLVAWGASYFWSPTDFINQQRAMAAIITPVDMRTGKPGLRLHVPLKAANLFLFTDFSHVTRNNAAMNLSDHAGQAWRLDGTIKGVNIGTVGYVSRATPTSIGFDATGSLLATDIYGEIAFTSPHAQQNDISTAMSIGASKFFGKEKNWTLRSEFYYNDTGFTDTAFSALERGAFIPFYSGKYYAYAEISATNLLQSTLDCSIFGFINMADGSYCPALQCTIDLPGIIPFTMYTRYFGGRSNREFTSTYGGRTFQAGIRIMVSL